MLVTEVQVSMWESVPPPPTHTHTQFEWVLAKHWGVVFPNPFMVTLTDSLGNRAASRIFNDSRTFYLWEGVNQRARFVRLDSLEYTGLCVCVCV